MKSTIRTTPLLPKARSLPKTLGRPKANGLLGRPKEPSAFLQMNRRLKSLRLKMARSQLRFGRTSEMLPRHKMPKTAPNASSRAMRALPRPVRP